MLPPAYYYFMVLVVRSACVTLPHKGIWWSTTPQKAMLCVWSILCVFFVLLNVLVAHSLSTAAAPRSSAVYVSRPAIPIHTHTHTLTHRLIHKKQHQPDQTSNQPVGSSKGLVGVFQGYLGISREKQKGLNKQACLFCLCRNKSFNTALGFRWRGALS